MEKLSRRGQMDYSHCWYRPRTLDKTTFAVAIEDCRKVLDAMGLEVEFEWGHDKKALFGPKSIVFNGSNGQSYETFVVGQQYAPNSYEVCRPQGYMDSCTTQRLPYDVAVCACLVVLRHHFGKKFVVCSDGTLKDEGWAKAVEACKKTLGYGEEFRLDNDE